MHGNRAGLKLEGALDHFGLDVSGMRVLDAGLSTGGFTDCLLQRGASHVIGVDVGYGQVSMTCLLAARPLFAAMSIPEDRLLGIYLEASPILAAHELKCAQDDSAFQVRRRVGRQPTTSLHLQ